MDRNNLENQKNRTHYDSWCWCYHHIVIVHSIEEWGDTIDPVTAMAVATTAIKSIKTGIKLAKDTSEIAKELDKFFSAKNVIEEEAKKEQEKSKKNKSLNQQAMANVLNRKKLRDAERSLKESLVWSGNAQIWEDLVKKSSRLKKAQQEADEQAKYKKKNNT